MKNNIDGFEGEKIECSEFTEKVGKDIIDYKFEYKNNLKIIEMQHKELETYKKIAEKLAEQNVKSCEYYYSEFDNFTIQDFIEWARNEVENETKK